MSLIYNIISLSNELESMNKDDFEQVVKPSLSILMIALLMASSLLFYNPSLVLLAIFVIPLALVFLYPKVMDYEKNKEILNEDILKLISCVNVNDIIEYFDKDYDFKNESDEFNYIFIKICRELKYKEVLSDMSVVKIQRLIKKELPNYKINQYVTNLMIEELSNKNNNIIEMEGVIISNE